jgi:hypothetical protein
LKHAFATLLQLISSLRKRHFSTPFSAANKILILGMPFMYLEGNHTNAFRLIDLWDTNGYVYLKIRDLQTEKVNTIF